MAEFTEAPKRLQEAIKRAAAGDFVRYDVEIIGRDSGKEIITIDFNIKPVKDRDGVVGFRICEGRDVTEQRHLEREVARQKEELAKLDELKTQFFANISHEFRTPLTLMLGPLEDALADAREVLPPRQRERTIVAQRNGLRLQKLVNTLLDFRSACEKAGLALKIETPPLDSPVYVDREVWEKIVLNLVSKAFKFTLKGEIRVSVRGDCKAAILRVADTGTGIPEAEVPLIFDRFRRVEGAQGRTHEGTGIGLSLVQELVKLHKGSVAVESVLGQGTTFTVRIPFGSAHLPQDRIGGRRNQASTATRADAFVSEALRWLPDGAAGSELPIGDAMDAPPLDPNMPRARVLVADDNADMRKYLVRLLAPAHDVVAVANGEEALEVSSRSRPDLILTDVMMPRMDGFQLLQQLRADPERRDIPIIVLSARAGEEAKVEGLQRGADDYLVKPFRARELLARVNSNLELARSRSRSAKILREERQILELLVKVGTAVASEISNGRSRWSQTP